MTARNLISVVVVVGVGAMLFAAERRPAAAGAGIVKPAPIVAHSPRKPVPASAMSPALRARVNQALERMKWVGEMHSAAMKDLRAERAAWHGPEAKKNANRCATVLRLVRKYSQVSERYTGLRESARIHDARARAIVHSLQGCGEATPMSVFEGAAAYLADLTMGQEEEFTGDFINYTQSMIDSIPNAESVWDIYDTVDGLVAAAINDNISEADISVVAAHASLIDSSTNDWNAVGESGGILDYYGMSVFGTPRARWWKNALNIIGGDAIGCGTAVLAIVVVPGAKAALVAAAAAGGASVGAVMGGACAVGALGASAGVAWGLLMS